MKTLLALFCLLPTLCFSQGFGSFRTDQPFLAKDALSGPDYSTLSDGLIAYFQFDESGTPAASDDSVGAGYLARAGSTPYAYSTNGILNNGLFWPATAAYRIFTNVNSIMDFQGSDSCSMSIWVYFRTFGDMVIVGEPFNSGNPALSKWAIDCSSIYAGVRANFWQDDNTQLTIDTECYWTAMTNQWHFICIGYDNSISKGWSQIDAGTRRYTASLTGGLNPIGLTCPLHLGTFSDNTAWPLRNATVDELGIWNRTLTTNEVSLLFNNTNGLPLSTFYP